MSTLLTALLLALPAAPQAGGAPPARELLPETPANWAFERIELPLGFAPDIPWEGFEELAFAPGWAREGAADFWSYALALRVTGPEGRRLELDEAALEDFFERYYRGLCGAVGPSRGFEVDPEAIRAEVSGGGAAYTARVELIDAFFTGEPLVLHFELMVQPDPGGGPWTELFGMASPLDPGAAEGGSVWSELRALGAAWQAARPVPVFLNHVYFVPDLATYEALRDSEFLREFAVLEERTTHRGDLSYTGLYLYGESTYLEFLRPDPALGFASGATGVAFGVEQPGGIARMAAALEAAGATTFAGERTRDAGGEQVPWFDILGIQAATTAQRLQLFAMEYDQAFLGRWNPREDGLAGRIDRRAVLQRYGQVIGAPGRALFRDVQTLYLPLEAAEQQLATRVADACSFGALERVEGLDLEPPPGLDPLPPRRAAGGVDQVFLGGEVPGGVLMVKGTLHPRGDGAPDVSEDFGQVQLHCRGDFFTLLFEGLPKD